MDNGTRQNTHADAYNYLAEYYDRLMHDCDYDIWSQYLYKLLTKHGCAPDAAGADAACGTGSITQRLWDLGYNITGFDTSQSMLTYAAGKRDDCKPDYLQADILKFRTSALLDFMTCCCDGINYIPHAKISKVFANIYNNLKSGGVFLFDISSQYKYNTLLDNRTYADEADGVYCVFSGMLNAAKSKLSMFVELFIENDDGSYHRLNEEHTQYVYSIGQITEALEKTGFKTINHYGFLTQKKPLPHAERIQFAAVK